MDNVNDRNFNNVNPIRSCIFRQLVVSTSYYALQTNKLPATPFPLPYALHFPPHRQCSTCIGNTAPANLRHQEPIIIIQTPRRLAHPAPLAASTLRLYLDAHIRRMQEVIIGSAHRRQHDAALSVARRRGRAFARLNYSQTITITIRIGREGSRGIKVVLVVVLNLCGRDGRIVLVPCDLECAFTGAWCAVGGCISVGACRKRG